MTINHNRIRGKKIFIALLSAILAFMLVIKAASINVYANEHTVDYYEGHRLWIEFLESVRQIPSVEGWYIRIGGVNDGINEPDNYGIQLRHRNLFVNTFNYGSIDDWNNINLFERYIMTYTYLQPMRQIFNNIERPDVFNSLQNQNNFFDSPDNISYFLSSWYLWFSDTSHFFTMLELHGAPNALQAYENLMRWQYNHIMTTGTGFNFATGLINTTLFQPNIESVEVIPPPLEWFGFGATHAFGGGDGYIGQNDNDYDPEDLDISDEVLDGLLGVLDGATDVMDTVEGVLGGLVNTETDRGIWDNIVGFFRNNVIILSILATLLIASGVFILVIKKRMK